MSWKWKMMPNLKRNWLSVQNWHEEFDKFWSEDSKIVNNCTLMDCFWLKYIMFELNSFRGVMFDKNEYWCKLWRKTDLHFQKWHEEFSKFSPERSKVSKLELWWDLFIQSRKCLRLKLNESYVSWQWRMMQNLTCQFKVDMRNLTNFDRSTQKSQKLAL